MNQIYVNIPFMRGFYLWTSGDLKSSFTYTTHTNSFTQNWNRPSCPQEILSFQGFLILASANSNDLWLSQLQKASSTQYGASTDKRPVSFLEILCAQGFNIFIWLTYSKRIFEIH